MDIHNLGPFIKGVRKKLGFSQSGFAELMGPHYTRAMIANYETGRAKVPGDIVFITLAGIGSLVDISDCYNVVLDPVKLRNWRYPNGYPLDKVAK
jgi:transcriptional regulator with XRE-family HTH domain